MNEDPKIKYICMYSLLDYFICLRIFEILSITVYILYNILYKIKNNIYIQGEFDFPDDNFFKKLYKFI